MGVRGKCIQNLKTAEKLIKKFQTKKLSEQKSNDANVMKYAG